MANSANHPSRQHYVPRFLLRGFARGRSCRVAVFDKRDLRCFEAGIADVGLEKGYYDLPVEGGVATLEPGLAQLESRGARAIDRIRHDRSVHTLAPEERAALAALILNLYVRGPGLRARILDQMRQTKRALELINGGREPASQQIRALMSVSEAEAKAVSLRMTSDTSGLLPFILDKEVALFGTTKDCPFLIGDSPIALSNGMPPDPFRGSLALGVPGVEIYLPISESLALGHFSRESIDMIRRESAQKPKHDEPARQARRAFLASIIDGIASGDAVPSSREHVEGINSRQVVFAERFLYAGKDVFGPVRDLLSKHPCYRMGPRVTVSHPLIDAERAREARSHVPGGLADEQPDG